MAYFVFDLDLTLADIPMEVYNELSIIQQVSVNANRQHRYNEYVKVIADDELKILTNSVIQNGMLRPEIIPYMVQILNLKLRGRCKGIIIYSNNRDLINLEFVRDVLIECIRRSTEDIPIDTIRSLFCLCIHRLYPGRPTNTMNPPKTWPELRDIMMDNREACDITESLSPEDIYFFDDMIPRHTIAFQIPRDQYFQVIPYHRDKPENYKDIKESDVFSFEKVIYKLGYETNSLGGGIYRHTMKNRLKQKKQMRKHKYSKKNKRKNKVGKAKKQN